MKSYAGTWHSVFRIVVGVFWLYFASQKWHGIDWMRPLIEQSAQVNPVPGLHEFLLQVVVPNWDKAALAEAVAETMVGVLLVAGLATRLGAWLGTVLAIGLALTIAFLQADIGLRWVYYLAVLVNLEVVVNGPGQIALGHLKGVPASLRS
jgi:uncharacterized membrane protein YphA (DoxX/SURF4 family)